ncbi:MAG: DUF5804 family protein [Natronomonas sp.]
MARVCLLGDDDVNLRFELLSRETSREALATYEITEPYHNSIAVETVSLGAAVSLLNDLNWYLIRFVAESLIRDPSISETEYLSRELATQIRNDHIEAAEADRFLKLYGIEDGRLVEPMYTVRTGPEAPSYDLRDVAETLVVRIAESEFEDAA